MSPRRKQVICSAAVLYSVSSVPVSHLVTTLTADCDASQSMPAMDIDTADVASGSRQSREKIRRSGELSRFSAPVCGIVYAIEPSSCSLILCISKTAA